MKKLLLNAILIIGLASIETIAMRTQRSQYRMRGAEQFMEKYEDPIVAFNKQHKSPPPGLDQYLAPAGIEGRFYVVKGFGHPLTQTAFTKDAIDALYPTFPVFDSTTGKTYKSVTDFNNGTAIPEEKPLPIQKDVPKAPPKNKSAAAKKIELSKGEYRYKDQELYYYTNGSGTVQRSPRPVGPNNVPFFDLDSDQNGFDAYLEQGRAATASPAPSTQPSQPNPIDVSESGINQPDNIVPSDKKPSGLTTSLSERKQQESTTHEAPINDIGGAPKIDQSPDDPEPITPQSPAGWSTKAKCYTFAIGAVGATILTYALIKLYKYHIGSVKHPAMHQGQERSSQ